MQTDDGAVTEPNSLARLVEQAQDRMIGFPGATDIDYTPMLPMFARLVNNIGDPYVDGSGVTTKAVEREVIEWFADLFRAPVGDRWGYVTSGGSEGNLYGLYLARTIYPTGLVYCSEAAHYSIEKALDLLRMPSVRVLADEHGEMDYDDFRAAVSRHRDRPAIVVANIGTTMTEAVDDAGRINAILADLAVRERYIHSDAALAGVPLALLHERPRFDLADGADSVSVSGHKFFGTPIACGVVVARRSRQQQTGRPVDYIGSPDTTISGSRSGQAAALLQYAINRFGMAGHRERAELARELAAYTVDRLTDVGWPAWRNQHAFTVVLRTPRPAVTDRWVLATANGGISHIVCMPGITRAQIDRFVADLRTALEPTPATSSSNGGWRGLPAQIRPAVAASG